MRLPRMVIAAAALLTGFIAQAEEAPTKPRLLFVFAHPDDEVFVAPVLARAARKGQPVTVVYATSGDMGPGVSSMKRGEALANHRESEARCAMQALGNPDVRFLRLGDGTLGVNAHHPESPAKKLAAALKPIIDEGGYEIVFTWGPDGGYGHADHRMVSAITTQIVQSIEEGRPGLMYPGIPKGTLPPIAEMQTWGETDRALLQVPYEYSPEDLAASARAVDCHKTQFDAATRAGMMQLFDHTIWQGSVHFRIGLPELPIEGSEVRAVPGPPPGH
uniref:PIG-L deacetylase family protein n=1 Tax=Parerythrobacter lutipelagi TaxID=1964208 RepID=UPI0013762B1B|nr:PIG-L family deacetylase [Parerythrobacter lutipelagi]